MHVHIVLSMKRLKNALLTYCCHFELWCILFLHARYQNNQELLLINIITMISNDMKVTRDEMTRNEAGSRVRFNKGDKVPHCIEDISSRASSFWTLPPYLSWQPSWECNSKRMFWSGSHVRVGIWTAVGDKLVDFTILPLYTHSAAYSKPRDASTPSQQFCHLTS